MNPAAYFFSSTSTVSGKKSMPSRTFFSALAVTRTTVSPIRPTMAPCDCGARTPVSKDRVLSVPLIGPDTEVASAVLTPYVLFGAASRPVRGGSPREHRVRGGCHWQLTAASPQVRTCDDRPSGRSKLLPAKAEAGVDLPQALDVRLAKVGLEPLALSHELQQPPLGVEIVLVHLQM